MTVLSHSFIWWWWWWWWWNDRKASTLRL